MIGSALTEVGWTVGRIAVGGTIVGEGMEVSEGNGSVGIGVEGSTAVRVIVGSEVSVLAGGCVFVAGEVGVANGPTVFVRIATAVLVVSGVPVDTDVAMTNPVLVDVGVEVNPDRSSCGVLVACSVTTGGSTINTPISSIAAPAFSNVILTNRAWTDRNRVWIVSASETEPLKPVCSE